MSVQIGAIHGDVPAALLRMTSPAVAPRLRGLSATGAMTAIAAIDGTAPVGLAVASAESAAEGEVLSLYVAPERWNQGIGTRLLERAERELRARGCTAARLRYHTHAPAASTLERVLTKRGWSPPETVLILAKIDLVIVEEARWAQRRAISPPFALKPWLELTPAHQRQLQGFRDDVPREFWPLDDPSPPDPSSLALLHDDELAGWLLTHRLEADSVRFTILFVRPKFRTSVLSFALAAEAARRVRAMYGRDVSCALAVQAGNREMLAVVERKFRPWAKLWSEFRAVRKSL